MNLGVLQENLLVILSYDDERCKIIRGVIPIEMFGGPYKLVAARIYDYIDRFKKAPKDHIADLLADKLEGKTARENELYEDIIGSIHEASAGVNAEYVMSQLETFTRRQALRTVAIDLAKALQRDTDDALDEADKLIHSARHTALTLFDPGTRLSDKNKALDFLDISTNCFPTGIHELDKRGFGPTRKEMWLFMGDAKAGKTWALMQVAKMALMSRVKVLHISLEMSEARSAQRYFQALFAMSKRNEKFTGVKFRKDKLGRIEGFDDYEVQPKLSLDDPNIRKKLEKRIDKWGTRLLDNIIVKQFPTGHLTVPQLRGYMDNLETAERFVPDLLIVDYPDLMKIDKNNFRLDLDGIYKELRGIAVERNLALAIVSQTHRAASKAKKVRADNAAEAYSKVAHADCIITYSQTDAEKKLGLARLSVVGGRNDQDGITVVISQQYGMGNFVVDSTLMIGNYWVNVPETDET